MYAEKAAATPMSYTILTAKKTALSKETNNLPLTNFTYDIFQISAQGLSGFVPPHRDEMPGMYDNQTLSPGRPLDSGWSRRWIILVDFGVGFHGKFSRFKIGSWQESNGAGPKLKFRAKEPNSLKEASTLK